MTESNLPGPLAFDDYLLQQASRAFACGSELRDDIAARLPRLLARMAECRSIRTAAREQRGLRVPAVLFLAIAGTCNLRCRHCYTSGYGQEQMPLSLAKRILAEAYELGVSLIVVTGGEPLLHGDFFSIPPDMPDVPFLIFTNGTLLPEFLTKGELSANMLWAVSVDGPREWNDARRGEGTFAAACEAMAALQSRGNPFGFSATLSIDNLDRAASPEFVSMMAERGCRSGFFLEQIPGPVCDPPLGERIASRLAFCREESSIPLIGFPADEVQYGGCQAGGNGIAHISPDGFVEPCPAAHIAADSLRDVSLEAAFSNPFFEKFGQLKTAFSTGVESCTYADNDRDFQKLLTACGARPTL